MSAGEPSPEQVHRRPRPGPERALTASGRLGRWQGRLRGRAHVLPDFLIIGAARAGTTTLMQHLVRHPDVLRFPNREVHFFDGPRYALGTGWYRLQFPTRREVAEARRAGSPALCGEKSPFYLADPATPARIAEVLPDARFIALLRDPTARAMSHWNIRRRKGVEHRSFESLARGELELLASGRLDELDALDDRFDPGSDDDGSDGTPVTGRHGSYLVRGLYGRQLDRWSSVFPRERILVLESEQLFTQPAVQLERVWRHLGLPPGPVETVHRNKRGYPPEPIDPGVIADVRAFFRPHNARLAGWLGGTPSWD